MVSIKRAVASVAIAACGFTAIGQAAASATPTLAQGQQSRVQAAKKVSGEEAFRALFFAQGPLAEQFPSLRAQSAKPPASLQPSIDNLIAQMRATDAGFFDKFGRDITSGKRARVQNALESAQSLMEKVAVANRGGPDQVATGGDCVWAFAVVVVTLAAAGNVAYAVNAVRTGNVAWNRNWFWSAPNDSTSTLQRERWVDEIATTL